MARRRRPPRPGALADLAPLKILTQILLLQLIYYISGTFLILFTALIAGRGFSLDLVFNWRSLRGDTTVGWMLGLVWVLNCCVGVISLLLLIARSKLVPDFVLTLHFIHLLLTSLYSGSLPQNWLWWALQLVSAGLMTSLGVWACQWRELRPISFGGLGNSSSATAGGDAQGNTGSKGSSGGINGSADAPSEFGDEDSRYGGRRGRGRGRDGAGEYEMVAMKNDGEGT